MNLQFPKKHKKMFLNKLNWIKIKYSKNKLNK